MPQSRHCSPTLLFLPDSRDITHWVSFSFAIVAAVAASWDDGQPTVNYSSLQVAVTYAKGKAFVWAAWDRGCTSQVASGCSTNFSCSSLFHWISSTQQLFLPWFPLFQSVFLSQKLICSLQSHPITVLHFGPSRRGLKDNCPGQRGHPECSPTEGGETQHLLLLLWE